MVEAVRDGTVDVPGEGDADTVDAAEGEGEEEGVAEGGGAGATSKPYVNVQAKNVFPHHAHTQHGVSPHVIGGSSYAGEESS